MERMVAGKGKEIGIMHGKGKRWGDIDVVDGGVKWFVDWVWNIGEGL